MVNLNGEEIASLVLDIGSASLRCGYGGEDTPRVNLTTAVGRVPSSSTANGETDDAAAMQVDGGAGSSAASASTDATTFIGDHLLGKPRPHMTIDRPIQDGLVSDWSAFEALVDYAFKHELEVTPPEFPLFMVESVHSHLKQREKLVELAFEKWQVPATYTHYDAVTSAFANGRPNALVIDVGASGTKVTPIYEGYVLRKGALTTPWGGLAISSQLHHLIQDEKDIKITPRYLVQTRRNVDLNKPSEAVLHKLQDITPSFHQWQVDRCLDDLKQTICMTSEAAYHEMALAQRAHKAYEFPDGFNTVFGTEKYRAVEGMFTPGKYYVPTGDAEYDAKMQNATPLVKMIKQSIDACDVDVRPHLLSNIVITGGSSLFPYFTERLNYELTREIPNMKIRAVAAGSTVERKFASWIGGSILASLGTFQQLWLSKEEYAEHGSAIVEKRLSH